LECTHLSKRVNRKSASDLKREIRDTQVILGRLYRRASIWWGKRREPPQKTRPPKNPDIIEWCDGHVQKTLSINSRVSTHCVLTGGIYDRD